VVVRCCKYIFKKVAGIYVFFEIVKKGVLTCATSPDSWSHIKMLKLSGKKHCKTCKKPWQNSVFWINYHLINSRIFIALFTFRQKALSLFLERLGKYGVDNHWIQCVN
jgi:hypothetical protein